MSNTKLYAVSDGETKSLKQTAREAVQRWKESRKKSSFPEPWKQIDIHDGEGQPAPRLDVDGILEKSLGDLIGKG